MRRRRSHGQWQWGAVYGEQPRPNCHVREYIDSLTEQRVVDGVAFGVSRPQREVSVVHRNQLIRMNDACLCGRQIISCLTLRKSPCER